MRFFENQDRARRNTTLLVALFSAAVLIITLAVDVLIYIAASADQAAPPRFDAWLLSPPGLLCSGVTLGVMALGSVYRFFKLAGGGIQVARMAGARAIDMTTQNPQERRFINLVEEMAIASGIPVPHLFVMDREAAINAFVAGYEPGEAVLVVTRGALDQLTRDELQGVIGHEFSHILNGDMRLNVRLIAILAGILLIGQIGQVLVRSGGHRPRGKRNEGASVAMLGLALMGIGYIGLFFGRLIKSAIARQREYLADASSVQFTRNPEGIGGALYKIALNDHRALLSHTHHAEDLNHLCFGESVRMQFMQGWLASHPPLEERISAIDAQLLAKLRARYGRRGERLSTHAAQTTQTHHTATPPEVAMGFSGGTTQPVNPSLSSQTGQISQVSEHYAQSLLQRLPQTFKDLLHTTTGAVNLCYALALREAPSGLRAQSIAELPADGALRFERAQLEQIEQVLWDEGAQIHFPALELALPALRGLSQADADALRAKVLSLARTDARISLSEFALISYLERHLTVGAGKARPSLHHSYKTVEPALKALLWLVARSGARQPEEAGERYQIAIAGFPVDNQPPAAEALTPDQLLEHLQTLSRLTTLLKPAVLDACGDCILADGQVNAREYELVRILADYLDCPLPPLIIPATTDSADQ